MITVPHPTKRFIDDERTFLEFLIQQYPKLHDEWKAKTLKEFEKQADEVAEGDEEVRLDVYHSLASGLDEYDSAADTFHSAMLIMVYSYYETVVHLLYQKAKRVPPLAKLCEANRIRLNKERQDDLNFLYNVIRPVRNHFVHNNRPDTAEDSKELEQLKAICQARQDLDFNDGRLTLTNDTLSLEALKRAHRTLSYVAEKLGYTTKYIGKTPNK